MLYINHFDVQVQSLDLDGALVVEAEPGASITIDGLQVHNRGWEWQPLKEGNSAAEHERIRYANTHADTMLGTPNPYELHCQTKQEVVTLVKPCSDVC